MSELTPEQEIDAIDARAFELAIAVLRDPRQRAELFDEAERLANRLVELNEQLERERPAAHKRRAQQVSEATLDLLFARLELEIFSLRLAKLREPGASR